MNVFKETLQYIEEKRNEQFIGIPFQFGKLDQLVPYIEKKRYFLVFGSTGVGKTKFALNRFVIKPYLYARDTGYKLKILYLSLEVPKYDVMGGVISYLFALKYGEKYSKEYFIRDKPSNEIMQKLYRLEEDFSDFQEIVEIENGFRNTKAINKYVTEHFLRNGKISNENDKLIYTPNDDLHTIVLTDTLNALVTDVGKSRSQTIFDYSLEICKNKYVELFNATVCNIQQQNKSAEQAQYTFKGGRVELKTLPDRSALSECTFTANDADYILSLYSPMLYGIQRYPFEGSNYFDMNIWGDNYRRVCLEKSRHGVGNFEAHSYFDGRINSFMNLPQNEKGYNDLRIVEQLNSNNNKND